jgi:hypothetical protein
MLLTSSPVAVPRSAGSTLVVTCPGLRLPTWNRILSMSLRERLAEKRRVREYVSRCARIALDSATRTESV